MDLSKRIDELKDEIVEKTQEIVRIKSTEEEAVEDKPFGLGVHEALEYTLDLCESLGFKTKNLDNMVGYAEIGQGEELIGILAHLDVVPEGDEKTWNNPPYSGAIADGKIFGRGTIDDKGPAIAGIYAMKAILDADLELNKRIRIIFGLNEETHWKSIQYYVENEEIPQMAFTPDSDFPVIHGEKGILVFNLKQKLEESLKDGGIEILSIAGGNRPNMVPDYAEAKIIDHKPFKDILKAYNSETKGNISFERKEGYVLIQSKGVSAHGARPESGINAIAHLLDFLSHLDLAIGDLANFIRFYKHHINTEINGESIGCHFSDELSGPLTFNVGTIKQDSEEISLGINIRYPITYDDSQVFKGMETVLDETVYNMHKKINIEKLDHMAPIYFEKDHPLIEALMGVYKKHTGDSSEPLTIGGGTYARSMPNAVAFGPLFSHRVECAHQADEHIFIDDLILATKIYADALKSLIE